jgi:hypothetical protein
MTAQLPVPPALAPFHTRWLTFVEKIRARVREIETEAIAAYREVIAIDVVDGTGVTGVSTALKSRLIALRQKVDDAWTKIDNEMDGAGRRRRPEREALPRGAAVGKGGPGSRA